MAITEATRLVESDPQLREGRRTKNPSNGGTGFDLYEQWCVYGA